MTLLVGRWMAAGSYGLAAIIILLYVILTRRKFFLGLVFPILYVCFTYVALAINVGNDVPTETIISYFQLAQITLAFALVIVFGIRLHMHNKGL